MAENDIKNTIKEISKTILLLIIFLVGKAQYYDYENFNQDKIYDKTVFSAVLYKGNNPLSPPFLNLNNPDEFLTLEFDLLSEEVRNDLQIRIIPMDRYWKPLDIIESEFFNGFTTLQITDFSACENCLKPYVHYHITFPQAQDKFLKSGNYIVVVESIDNEEEILLSRRFWVTENIIPISADREISPNTSNRLSMQYINFSIKPVGLNIQDPAQDLDVVILQNFNWNTSATIDKPTYIYPDRYEYSVEPQQFFQAGNEFRIADLTRILTGRGRNIRNITYTDTGYIAKLVPDEPRSNKPYFSYQDLNGAFILASKENAQSETQAEYVNTNFYLLAPRKYDGDVYIFGKISDWGNDQRFKMTFVEDAELYHLQIPLKQGIYNYLYAIKKGNSWDIQTIEGSFYETENTYAIFVYYRPFGYRYDRIVGFFVFNSYD